jgi:hypothetical protein
MEINIWALKKLAPICSGLREEQTDLRVKSS